jgi:3-hydroxybutyryl-CoA dehydrogenase
MIRKVAILGAGTMGYGLALDFGRHGIQVQLMDVNEAVLQKGLANIDISLNVFVEEGLIDEAAVVRTKENIRTHTSLEDALTDVDMVIEALPEVLAVKQDIFKKADPLAPAKALFVSNSSSLKLSEICSVLSQERKKRSLMAHYFNPPEIMPLVELLSLPETDEAVMTGIREFYLSIGKAPVRIKKEAAGLSANRIQMAVWREILWQLENGIADKEDLDAVLAFGPAFRWATTGVITMLDMTGLDIIANISDNLCKELDASPGANPLLAKLCTAKKLGLKTGEGFFKYPEEERPGVKDAYVRRLARQLKVSLANVKTAKLRK